MPNPSPTKYWVYSGPGIPCGARELDASVLGPSTERSMWLDVCILGQHLPQMYSREEIYELHADQCEMLGICPDCFGFGDVSNSPITHPVQSARGIDQLDLACANCGGTGRPMLRIYISRSESATTAQIRPIPHKYVPPQFEDPELAALFGATPDMCLGCGMPPDGLGPRGEKLHPEYEGEDK